MKLYVCALLLLLPLLGLVNSHGSDRDRDRECNLEKALKSLVKQYCPMPDLECVSKSTPGSSASCSSGYTAASCSCGMSCGSWNIVDNTRCHCQCPNMDWTTAVCCRNTIL